ncbi:MAG: HD domain-containing phosphohydrolase, partial [Candidatus Omnitrophota bacterium]|nr:HD domain-containing phosphohydrolase [Candidatus Omnitrophota bacterium]
CEVLSGSLVPDDLVHLVFQHDEYRDNYLYTHSVNVCLVAVRIARELNFSKSAMQELIIASLFHDIGMMKISTDIWNKDGGLSGGEYEEVRKHPARGEEIFKSLSGISEVVPTVIGQHHEKADGSGYPNRLTKDNIHFMARLIGLVDSYVARIHTRLWRPRYLPDKAIQEILDQEGNYYDPYFMKAMLRYISIFPVGSWVRISSGEIGNVVRPNEVIPMRPVLSVVFDRKGVKLGNPRMIDLSKQLLIHVEECIEPEMLEVEVEK